MTNFINLHTNTEYSILESSIKIDKLIAFAKKHNIKTLSITDHNNMFGVAEFIKKTKAHNIKPIIGLDLNVDNFRLILLAQNYKGYLHLLKLSSMKMNDNNISISDIDASNLFVIDHPRLGCYQLNNTHPKIHNYYIGLNKGTDPNGVAIFETRSLLKSESNILPILENIKSGKDIKENRIEDYSFKLEINMEYSMIQQAQMLADKCNIVFPKYHNQIPKFDNAKISSNYLKELLVKSLKILFKDQPHLDKAEYVKRYKYEFQVITSMGYDDYFLIIADMIHWAKTNKIIIGPGRGSASGSLVSYLLGITEIDPIKYDLLFERFLNPDRQNMPDIDIDIQDNRRNEVVNYVIHKYGQEHVAQIVTFSILGAKSSLRDAARALNMSVRDVDIICKLIKPSKGGHVFPLEHIYNNTPAFRSMIDNTVQYTKLFKYACLIEGLPRQTGTHAAGIVLSEKRVSDVIPTMKSPDGKHQTQFSMDFLEERGLFKIDLLGLRNLTIIKEIQKEIFKNYKHKVNLKKISFNDDRTNQLFTSADTNGIFQFESWGMKNALKKIKVSSLDDVIAIIALYRPGPMQFIEEYAARKQGLRIIHYVHSSLESILKSTYGIIIFQEQIMQIVQTYAGMSLAEADIFRRAISKKNILKLEQQKTLFFNMSATKNREKSITLEVWDLIFKFANYGFAKSHAVAYSVISYWMAFFKARFPIEFYTPLLTSSIGSFANTELYINELKNKDIKIISPSINTSHETYYNHDHKIYVPLTCLKGVGSVMSKKLIEERKQNGLYKSFLDFIIRSQKIGLSSSVIEILIKGNTLSEFENVSSLLHSLPLALRFAKMVVITKDNETIVDDSIVSTPLLIKVDRDIEEEVKFQKYYYGFSMSTFLTDGISKYPSKLRDLRKKKTLQIVAQVKWVTKILTKKDKKEMAFIQIFDSTMSLEATIMPNVFKFYPKIKRDDIYIFNIISSEYKGDPSYTITKITQCGDVNEK